MHVNGQTKKRPDPTAGLDSGSGLAALLRPFWAQLLESAFLDAAETPEIAVAFDLANPFVQTVLAQLAAKVVAVTATTRSEIQDLVGRQAAEGWSMETLASEIAGLAETRSATRATTIARTESASAYTQGSIAAYKASGVVDRVQWLIGPHSCDDCLALADQVVALGAEFAPGVSGPPYHPNCTCALAPVLSATED
jgi:SPP1 gp7 family putative phage head morphogenesis protein